MKEMVRDSTDDAFAETDSSALLQLQEERSVPFKRSVQKGRFLVLMVINWRVLLLAAAIPLSFLGGIAYRGDAQPHKPQGCTYSTPDVTAVVPLINRFYLEIFSGNQFFTPDSQDFSSFSEFFPDLEKGEHSASLAFARDLRFRLSNAINHSHISTLEKFQLGYVVSDVDLMLRLSSLGLYHLCYGVVPENGLLGDPTLVTADVAKLLLQERMVHTLSETDRQRILRWLNNYAAKVDAMISYYEMAMAEGKTHANVTMVKTWQDYYVPALTFNYSTLCDVLASPVPASFSSECIKATTTVMEKNRRLRAWYEQRYLPACASARPNSRPGLSFVRDGPAAYRVFLDYHLGYRRAPGEIHRLGLTLVEQARANISAITGLPFASAAAMMANQNNATLYICTAYEGITSDTAVSYFAEKRQHVGAFIDTFFDYYPRGQVYMELSGSGSTFFQSGRFDHARNSWSSSGVFKIGVMGKCHADDDGKGGAGREGQVFEKMSALGTLTHEAFPGHGLQIPLQLEIGCSLSPYLSGPPTGFVEGWALYTEMLPFYMNVSKSNPFGLYTPSVERLGFYHNDMLRDVRLVEDTGLHDLGWSFDQGVKYMVENGLGPDYAEFETYRYITEPGQAVAYMIGRLSILEMKAYAKSVLGPLFREQDFHQVLTRFGGSTLANMNELVQTYVSMKLDKEHKKDHNNEFGSDLIASMYSPSSPIVGKT